MGPVATNATAFVQNPAGPTILDPSLPMGGGSANYNPAMPPGAVNVDNGNMSMRNMSGVDNSGMNMSGQMSQPPTQFNAQRPEQMNQFPQFAMFQQPIVQDMAMQYGQHLADQGKQIMESQFSKWVPVTKLKYYFAVDNNYVIKKLRLLFFPFVHQVSVLLRTYVIP